MQCTKVKYMTQAGADSMVRWMVERKRTHITKRSRERLHSYRCDCCGFWHVGKVGLKKGA